MELQKALWNTDEQGTFCAGVCKVSLLHCQVFPLGNARAGNWKLPLGKFSLAGMEGQGLHTSWPVAGGGFREDSMEGRAGRVRQDLRRSEWMWASLAEGAI